MTEQINSDMKPLNVLSLFDGISCGRLALERAGIPVSHYFASEIDKYAIQVTQKNYSDTIQLGDITKIDFRPFKNKIDLIMGGVTLSRFKYSKNKQERIRGRKVWSFLEIY